MISTRRNTSDNGKWSFRVPSLLKACRRSHTFCKTVLVRDIVLCCSVVVLFGRLFFLLFFLKITHSLRMHTSYVHIEALVVCLVSAYGFIFARKSINMSRRVAWRRVAFNVDTLKVQSFNY